MYIDPNKKPTMTIEELQKWARENVIKIIKYTEEAHKAAVNSKLKFGCI